MLENGAQANITAEEGSTPLHIALENSNLPAIKLVNRARAVVLR
jgi:ankyrin repeat protein